MAACATSAQALDVTTEDNPPFNYREGQRVAGLSTEVVEEMGRRAGVPMKIEILPWGRAYLTARDAAGTCVYSIARLPHREALFEWIGPISENKWALFARDDFPGPIEKIEDAKAYRIGGVENDAKYQYLQSLGFTRFDLVGDDNLNAAKLASGRIDLWITGLYKGKQAAAQRQGGHRIKPVFVVRKVDYYLACNPRTPRATINALSQALQKLREEGYLKAVSHRYASRTN
jgi:polar amino acid transport system substrate-binding protein